MTDKPDEHKQPVSFFSEDAAAQEQVVARFEQAWQAGEQPKIEAYVVGEGAERRLLLVELVHVDLECRLKAGEPARVEEYLQRFPELAAADQAVVQLIQAEYRLRGRQELDLRAEDYVARFPQYRGQLVGNRDRQRGANYHLLFGLLALQNDFVSREELVAATSVWLSNKSKPLSRILLERQALTPDEFALLSALVDKHLQKHGDDVDKSLGALSSLGSLRDELQSLNDPDIEQSLTHVSVGRPDADRDAGGATVVGASTSSGLRFRILRPHARGGLGQVSVALDEELNREVALKEILPQHAAQADSRARFVLEAEITGGLEHPGIVPVYGLGQYADGRPFYAMRFIKGDSLETAISRFHRTDPASQDPGQRTLAFRKLLGRFIDVCHAIAYAHSRGVLHRDLKPGNIMLGKYGETLVLDWGLAKPLGHREPLPSAEEQTLRPRSGSGSSPTQLGSAIGTPAFMSPEQAAGRLEELGPASDIYGLGATLYYLLTGRAPYTGSDIGQVLAQVQVGTFRRPREVRRGIPAALEAICVKALSLRPEQRYATPQALAEDVEHWLADEPIAAHRESFAERTFRLLRRHRTWAQAAAATLLLVTIVSLVFGMVVNSARLAEQTSKAQADAARQEAESSLETSMQAVNQMLIRVGNERLADIPQMEEVQRQLLEDAVAFCERLLQSNPIPRVRAQAAVTYRLLGATYSNLGDYGKARSAYEQAQRLGEELTRESPDDPDYQYNLATTYGNLGTLMGKLNDQQLAVEYARKSIATSSLAQKHPQHYEYRRRVAWGMGIKAWLFKSADRCEEAEQAYEDLIPVDEQLAADFPDEVRSRRDVASDYVNLGNLLTGMKRYSEAETMLRKALDLSQKLAADYPQVADYRATLGAVHNDLGMLFAATERVQDAVDAYQHSAEIRKALVADFPSTPQYGDQHARTLFNQGLLLMRSARIDDAIPVFQEAAEAYRQLTNRVPDDPGYRDQLGRTHCNVGVLLSRQYRFQEAELAYRQAIAVQTALVEEFPASTSYREPLIFLWGNLDTVLWRVGKLDDAISASQKVIELLRDLVSMLPGQPAKKNQLETRYFVHGFRCRQRGKYEDAETAYRAGMTLNSELTTEFPDNAAYQVNAGDLRRELGWLCMSMNRMDEAEDAFRKALQLHEVVVTALPEEEHGLRGFAADYSGWGRLLGLRLHRQEAARAYQQSLQLYGRLLQVISDEPDLRADRADVEINLAILQEPGAAVEQLRQAAGVLEELVSKYSSVPDYAARLATCRTALASQLADLTQWSEAETTYTQATADWETIVGANPNVPAYRSGLGAAQRGLAEVQAESGHPLQAGETLNKAIACHTAALDLNPQDALLRAELAHDQGLLVTVQMRMGQLEAAEATARELLAHVPTSAHSAFEEACCFARCVGLSTESQPTPEVEGGKVRLDFAEESVQLLRRAVELGLADAAVLRATEDLAPVRDHPRYLEIVKELEAKPSQVTDPQPPDGK